MNNLNFLYWNTYTKDLTDEIFDLVKDNTINFVVLLENSANEILLVNKLKMFDNNFVHHSINRIFKKPKIFSSIPLIKIKEINGHGRYGIYEIEFKDNSKLLLVIVHFPSKKDWGNPSDHFGLCVELKGDIEAAELNVGTKNTIILGDFNMNPFEDGLISSSGLHNVNNKEIALTKNRFYQGRDYDFFYNPMWSFFGENSKGFAQGTHFYNTHRPICHYWNIYDQIIIRPELIPNFDETKLDIITSISSKSLLKKINGYNRIDLNVSDHLPLKFELKSVI